MFNNCIKIEMPKCVEYIIDTLTNFEYEAYIVGGCVRDSILNKIPNDYDITTNAKPEKVVEIFESLGLKVIPTGLKHGTVTVLLNNEGYEITTYRIDGEYADNRHPNKVEFTSNLKEDLSRRDFTINAMAYNNEKGLVDFFGGTQDIKAKIIRCVGNSYHRFSEDALRMMRAYRFAAQLGFNIDGEIKDSIRLLNSNLKNVSIERIREEFNKILLSSNPLEIYSLNWCGLLKHFIPEYDICEWTNQENPYHVYSVGKHLIHSVENIEKQLHLRLTMFFHDICKPSCKTFDAEGVAHFYNHAELSSLTAEEILKRMKYDNRTIEKVKSLVKYHDREISENKSIRKLLNLIGEENFRDLLKVKEADIKAQNLTYYCDRHDKLKEIEDKLNDIINARECFTIKDLYINGKDLMELGIKQGKEIGIVLNNLFEIVLDDPKLNDKSKLIDIIKSNYKQYITNY